MAREMKNSGIDWIGEIPADWKMRKIKYILSERNEKNEPIKSTNILSLTASQGVIPYSEKEGGGNKPKEDLSAYKLAYPDDIVMNSMNILSGSVGLSKYFGCVSPVYYMLYSDDENVNIKYYNYIFQTTVFQKSLMGLGNGIMMKETEDGKLNTIRMRIPLEKLNGLLLPIPSKEEQKKIVNKLESIIPEIDKVIAETKSSIENYKEYKQSVITEAVTKGLNKNVQMKDSGIDWIGKISENATVTTAGKLFNIILGKMISPNQTKENETFESYFCAANVHFEDIQYNGLKRMWFSEKEKEIYKVQKGDLLVVEGGAGAGGSHIVDVDIENCYIQNSIMIARTKSNTPNKWLYYVIYSLVHQGYIDFVCNKATIPHFTKEKLQNVPVVFFEEETMNKIIDYLDKQCSEIDNLISEKEAMLVNLEEYKKSLIYEYVTGKKDV